MYEEFVEEKEKTVLLLNGPSSSGKSTLTEVLQNHLQESINKEYGSCSIDEFLKMTPEEEIFEEDVFEISTMIGEKALRELESKDGVIVDHVITSERIFQRLKEMLADYRMICIRVTCPIEELCRREAARGNRCPGSAEASYEYLYPQNGYDVTVDTYEMSLQECCEKILKAMEYQDV